MRGPLRPRDSSTPFNVAALLAVVLVATNNDAAVAPVPSKGCSPLKASCQRFHGLANNLKPSRKPPTPGKWKPPPRFANSTKMVSFAPTATLRVSFNSHEEEDMKVAHRENIRKLGKKARKDVQMDQYRDETKFHSRVTGGAAAYRGRPRLDENRPSVVGLDKFPVVMEKRAEEA
ncbi:hypothetical protein DFJ73DRAFT_757962 [Zopfochytrium polystomum]|nr:hypothetical protein DFJ73DRAFT_757962 [Zopfochytrium polystomum]